MVSGAPNPPKRRPPLSPHLSRRVLLSELAIPIRLIATQQIRVEGHIPQLSLEGQTHLLGESDKKLDLGKKGASGEMFWACHALAHAW